MILAIDFGTSNTAAAVLDQGRARIIPLEDGKDTLPTAIFLDFDSRQTLVGRAAIAALIDGREGRFMRALKSVLGTALMRETRQFLNERLTLIEITARFLARIRQTAEAEVVQPITRALSGRPVHFHNNAERDAQALVDLQECYKRAGFDEVDFLPEPQAAAMASGQSEGLSLVVDIGGGTSDFTVFRRNSVELEVLANHGIRLGGTDFDQRLSLDHVMPLFGKGTHLKAEFGSVTHEAPVSLFHDLATWSMIPFLYVPAIRRDAARMAKMAVQPERMGRLTEVLDNELGHDVAFAVEAGKIAANGPEQAGRIDLGIVERGLTLPLTGTDLTTSLTGASERIEEAALETLRLATVPPEQIERIIFVGGSSLLHVISARLESVLPNAEPVFGAAFTGIVDGLALSTAP